MNAIRRHSAFARASSRARIAVFIVAGLGAFLLSTAVGNSAQPQVLTVSTGDANADGHIDKITATFSTPMSQNQSVKISSGPGDPGLSVAGYDIAAAGFPTNNTTLVITLTPKAAYDSDATPLVHYEPGAPDGTNLRSTLTGELTAGDFPATTDKAGPVLLTATAKDVGNAGLFNSKNNNGDQLWLGFSEPVKLTGADPVTRWNNLERAIKINAIQTGLCADGDNTPSSFNFPQPAVGQEDTVDATVPNVLHITFTSHAAEPQKKFTAVPQGCNLGVDPSAGTSLTDLANNGAVSQDLPTAGAHQVWVQPVDIKLVAASTVDKNLDGKIDGVQMVFDQFIVDSTVNDNLSHISITKGGVAAIVDTSAIDAGGTANDNVVTVNFTLPAGQSWDGGSTPHIAYTKPSSCTGTGGAGIKGNVPTPGFKACVTSFDQDVSDGVGPIILGARTLDANGNGLLDRIELTFSEPLAAAHVNGWTVNANPITSITIDASNARKASAVFPEGTSGDTGSLPPIAYTTQALANATTDAAGNQIIVPGAIPLTDAAAPRIRSATVYDDNHDGTIDRVDLGYSESLASFGSASEFTVGGATATAVAHPVGSTLSLTVAVPGTAARDVVFTAGSAPVADATGNPSASQTVTTADVVDQAAPVGVISIAEGAPMNAGTKTVALAYSESMKNTAAPAVQFNAGSINRAAAPVADDANHTHGWRLDDPTLWDGTFAVQSTDCTNSTGCAASVTADGAKDLPGLTQIASTFSTSIDTVAPAPPTIGSFATSEAPGESAPANTLNMFTRSFLLGGTFLSGDATGGKLEILLDGSTVTPAATSPAVGASDSTATAVTSFADAAALQAAIPEGTHTLSVRLCDASQNCSPGSVDTLSVTADYTGVGVSLTQPSGVTAADAGSALTIGWDGDDAAADFDHVDLAYSTDGTTYPNAIASGITDRDGAHEWTVPWVDGTIRIRVATVDADGNKTYAASEPITVGTPVTFTDVPRGYWAHIPIEKLNAAAITGGCGGGKFCPESKVTRSQMAMFLVRALGVQNDLPAYTGRFADVAIGAPYADAVEYLAQHAITGGCGGANYCPSAGVTRSQMAAFILRALDQTDLPAYKGTFADVSGSAWYARWVESLYAKGITGGCASSPLRYCPNATVTRAQMAAFIARAWNL